MSLVKNFSIIKINIKNLLIYEKKKAVSCETALSVCKRKLFRKGNNVNV